MKTEVEVQAVRAKMITILDSGDVEDMVSRYMCDQVEEFDELKGDSMSLLISFVKNTVVVRWSPY